MTADAPYLVCPSCDHSEPIAGEDGESRPEDDPDDGDPTCPACGSTRAFRHSEAALPDPESEAYVKLDADSIDRS